jgi:acetylornithine deacetylase/succinyl-diaminopimelate desuccinylase-like protein
VRDVPAAEREAIRAMPFDEAAYLAELGAPAAVGEAGYSTLERQWIRPTLEVNGMWGGYQGPGGKTVIPSAAHAKLTCRLVHDQDPDEIVALVARHLETHVPEGTRLTVTPGAGRAGAARIEPNHFVVRAARRALSDVYGVAPLLVRVGSTVPISELFERHMGLKTLFFSFSTADEDFHAPNEFFRVRRLHEGLEAWARLWEELGSGSGEAAATGA